MEAKGMPKVPRPPRGLGPAGRKFWREIVLEYELDAPALELLRAAAECLDRVASAQQEVARVGEFFRDRWGQPKEHPGLAAERAEKILFARLVRELGFSDAPAPDPRPPRLRR